MASSNRHAAGIDFGSQNCVLALPRENGVDIISNQSSSRLTPNMVTFTENRRYPGDLSQQQQSIYINETISNLKDLICLPFDSELREEIEKRNCCKLEKLNDGNTGVVFESNNNTVFTPEQLIAYQLKYLLKLFKAIAPATNELVITAEPWWTHAQRVSLLNAAKIANIPSQLINAPTAGAVGFLMYHKNQIPDSGSLKGLFVDIGHASSKFYFAELSLRGVHIHKCTWIEDLGGRVFTERLAQLIREKINNKYKNPEFTKRMELAFIREVEKVKKVLSTNKSARFEFAPGDLTITLDVSREEFEEVTADLVDQIGSAIEELRDCGAEFVELIGGGSRVAAVRKRIEEITGMTAQCSTNGDEVVASGAGFVAKMGSRDFLPFDISASDGDGVGELIEAMHKTPTTAQLNIEGETDINFMSRGEIIARGHFKPGEYEISANESGIIESNGIEIVGALSKEQLKALQKAEAAMEKKDEYELQVDTARNALETALFRAEAAVNRDLTEFFTDEERTEAEQIVGRHRLWFEENEFERMPLLEYVERAKELGKAVEMGAARKAAFAELTAEAANVSAVTKAYEVEVDARQREDGGLGEELKNACANLRSSVIEAVKGPFTQMPAMDISAVRKELGRLEKMAASFRKMALVVKKEEESEKKAQQESEEKEEEVKREEEKKRREKIDDDFWGI